MKGAAVEALVALGLPDAILQLPDGGVAHHRGVEPARGLGVGQAPTELVQLVAGGARGDARVAQVLAGGGAVVVRALATTRAVAAVASLVLRHRVHDQPHRQTRQEIEIIGAHNIALFHAP